MISIPDECLYDYLKIIGDVAVPILVKYENFEIGKFAFDAFNLELDKCMIRTGGCIPQYQQLKEIINNEFFQEAVMNWPQVTYDYYTKILDDMSIQINQNVD